MEQPGLYGRHRDKNGEISRKHGNTLVSTLRKIYGPSFAPSAEPHETLTQVLAELDEHSLSQLVDDHEHGHLERKSPRSAIERPIVRRLCADLGHKLEPRKAHQSLLRSG